MTARRTDPSPVVAEARQGDTRQQFLDRSVNQRIFDEIILADTLLFQLESDGLDLALGPLRTAQENILAMLDAGAEIEGADLDEWRRARFVALQGRIEEEFTDAFDESERVLRSRLPEIAAAGTLLMILMMGRALPGEIRSKFDLAHLSTVQLRQIVNAKTAQRAWFQTFQMAKRDFRNTTFRAMNRARSMGDTAGSLGKTLAGLFLGAMGMERIARIFRTESIRIWNRVRRLHFNRWKPVTEGIVYIATLDNRTCMRCAPWDNQAFFWNPEPGQNDISDFPALPQHPKGRCTSGPIVKSANDLGFSDEDIALNPILQQLTGLPPRAINYEEWLRDQSLETQEQVLGKTRAKAFRQGKVTLQNFVSINRTLGGPVARIRTLKDLMKTFSFLAPP